MKTNKGVLNVFCTNCGCEVNEEDNFCTNCGNRIVRLEVGEGQLDPVKLEKVRNSKYIDHEKLDEMIASGSLDQEKLDSIIEKVDMATEVLSKYEKKIGKHNMTEEEKKKRENIANQNILTSSGINIPTYNNPYDFDEEEE